MNVEPSVALSDVPAETWQGVEMRRALAVRDLATVFRILQRIGVTQRAIAAATGLAASEVHEVLRGRRVMAYDVLCRIADGLGTPRGYLGLAYDAETDALVGGAAPGSETAGGRSEVHALLAHAAEVTLGVTDGPPDPRWQATPDGPTPVPGRLGRHDVEQVEAVTASLRAMDYRYGGGACRDAVLAQARWVTKLLHADAEDSVRHRLHVTLADLHNLAGWTSFDVGMPSAARRQFARALTQARQAGDPSLIANILYRTGRLHLHESLTVEALRFFQLGQLAAQDSACSLTVALLCANEAWAYACLGDPGQALRSLARARDEFARSDPGTSAPWVRFFSAADLDALTGMAYLELSTPDPTRIPAACQALQRSVDARDEQMSRSRAFELTALATALLRDHQEADAVRHGWQAADLAEQLRSRRVRDRLEPLAIQAAAAPSTDANDLAHHLTALAAQ
jgi:transcriptional regulator with XRE-family HTH domain